VIEFVLRDPAVRQLLDRLQEDPRGAVTAAGIGGSAALLLTAAAARTLGRDILCITAHLEEADRAADDLEVFSERPVHILSAFEARPGEGPAAKEIAGERCRLCALLLERATKAVPRHPRDGNRPPQTAQAQGRNEPLIIVGPVQALMQPVPSPERLRETTATVRVGQELSPRSLAEWLAEHGFERVDQVEEAGHFAVRGGIIDIFSPGMPEPIRVEFFGDQIESIRRFDLGTQRSVEQLDRAEITAAGLSDLTDDGTSLFFRYLNDETLIVFLEPLEITELGRLVLEKLDDHRGLYPPEAVFKGAEKFGRLFIQRFGKGLAEPTFYTNIELLGTFSAGAGEAVEELLKLAERRFTVVYCDAPGEAERLTELLKEKAAGRIRQNIVVKQGLVHRGFSWPAANIAVVPHHELFHRTEPRRALRRVPAARPIESFLDLEPGDYVVHVQHGIARFEGLRTIRHGEKVEEYLTLRFAGGATLHVPASQIHLVQKYVGAAGIRPRLSRLGGTKWKQTKKKVSEAVTELAAELLRIQAARLARPGIAFPPDSDWQRQFEESFPYQETEDQIRIAEEIKRDMQQPRPMDRLICGDVGYGKTELAMRAAFKCVEAGKQVAVLAPTTILAEQHLRTFRQRMAEYPIVIECLSRFRSQAEQQDIIRRTARGEVDILIGTHRLLSADVAFKDLGLVIIDEEQRFGVEQKERLKKLRETVDVLTLTATPIPRTLHMALMGLRDISTLTTPPVDRRAVVTQVVWPEPDFIRNAILRELARDGQVFFVHNRVKDIYRVAERLHRIVPEARIAVAHGQMPEDELADTMVRFINRQVDVLVCTAIIENGVDIPTANTMFIDEADLFGLADLHQLRGRIGRYRHRAYCYLLLPTKRQITPAAAKRLHTIEQYSELGAGFHIAMRDLEIRGAGNLLGPEQSGHIAAVGYELYCQLLEEAVRRLKAEPAERIEPAHVELEMSAYIPANYIASPRHRMEVYRRLSICSSPQDVEQLRNDLIDAFGKPPRPAERLLMLAEIRILAGKWKLASIVLHSPDVVIKPQDMRLAEKVFASAPGTVRLVDGQDLYWRPPRPYLEPDTLLAVLRQLLIRAGEPAIVPGR